MLPRALAILGMLCFCHCSVDKDRKETQRYIAESERQWAESVATGDTSASERILADDFIGVDPKARNTPSNRWSMKRVMRRSISFPIGLTM